MNQDIAPGFEVVADGRGNGEGVLPEHTVEIADHIVSASHIRGIKILNHRGGFAGISGSGVYQYGTVCVEQPDIRAQVGIQSLEMGMDRA